MKAKKLLKIIKAGCCDKNCGTKQCPMFDKTYGCLMLAGEAIPDEWNIKRILKAAKKAGKNYVIK